MQDQAEHILPIQVPPVTHQLITTHIQTTATLTYTDLRTAALPIRLLPVLPIPFSVAEVVVVAEVLREAVVFRGQAGNL